MTAGSRARVLTHNSNGYDRGCRCAVCREGAARRVREWRHRNRRPCDICCRVHQGRCATDDERTGRVTVTLPDYLRRRLDEVAPWGERSAYIRGLLERELS